MSAFALEDAAGGPCHFLNGRPVRDGDALELGVSGGAWLPVRYQWPNRPIGPPRLYLDHGSRVSAEPLELPADARVRWPKGGSHG